MDNFEFHIQVKNSKNKWERIASFQNECDRDDSMCYLSDKYEDCQFRTENKIDE